MSDITHSDELVTKQELASFYQGILPYLGGMPEAIANKFSKSDIFSTTEKMVGQWTNGKPIYQKTVNTGALPNNTVKTIAHGISNMDVLIDIHGITFKATSGSYTGDIAFASPLPFVTCQSGGTAQVLGVHANKTNIIFTGYGNNWAGTWTNSYVTLLYTKTTDSAVNMGDENDYSTTEKIIGTWVDGKPLYQKTFSTTSPVCSTTGTDVTKDVSIGANVDTIVDIKGILINSTGATHILPSMISVTAQSNTKVPQIKVNGHTNNASSDKNKVRITNNYADFSNLPMYITVQYTKV